MRWKGDWNCGCPRLLINGDEGFHPANVGWVGSFDRARGRIWRVFFNEFAPDSRHCQSSDTFVSPYQCSRKLNNCCKSVVALPDLWRNEDLKRPSDFVERLCRRRLVTLYFSWKIMRLLRCIAFWYIHMNNSLYSSIIKEGVGITGAELLFDIQNAAKSETLKLHSHR